MTALASLTMVAERLDFDLDEAQEIAVEGALEDLSEEARFYGGQDWPMPEDAPNIVRTTIAKATARWARNMNGYIQSKAADEAVTWAEAGDAAGSAAFSAAELKLLKAVGEGRKGSPAFGTITIVARGPRTGALSWDGRVPIQGCPETFPFYNTETDGW